MRRRTSRYKVRVGGGGDSEALVAWLSRTAASLKSSKKHEFSVDMTCEGCSNAVTRVLNKLGGVQFEIDLPNKKVCIDSEHSVDTLLATLKKTGKSASYLGEK
ncbi:copper transport protein ATOX1 isoform X1 [Mauremys reevesii]|nr:copper transport protein ATOX1 isoform X1 [Mauremys reevesii]